MGKVMKWAALENQSTTVRMTVLHAEGERPVLKSRGMWDQGHLSIGTGQMYRARSLVFGTNLASRHIFPAIFLERGPPEKTEEGYHVVSAEIANEPGCMPPVDDVSQRMVKTNYRWSVTLVWFLLLNIMDQGVNLQHQSSNNTGGWQNRSLLCRGIRG